MEIPINSFLKKSEAIDYYKKYLNSNNNLKLFAEDKKENGSKIYYVMKCEEIFNKIISKELPSYYEFWTNTTNIKFALDIDIPIIEISNYKDSIDIVKEIIKKIKLSAYELYQHEYKYSDFIVLENDYNSIDYENKKKYSFHIICKNLLFENHLVVKDFYQNTHEKYNLKYCDASIYNLSCFRLCFCTKKGKNNILLPLTLNIDENKTFDYMLCETPYLFWLKTLITYNNNSNVKTILKNTIKNKEKKIKNVYNNIKIKDILYKLSFKYCDEYEYWIKIGMILFNISNSENNYFELWNEW